jgi:hypothetical protein
MGFHGCTAQPRGHALGMTRAAALEANKIAAQVRKIIKNHAGSTANTG